MLTTSKMAFVALIACTMLTAALTAVSSEQAVNRDGNGVIDLVSQRTKEILAGPSAKMVGEVHVSWDGKTKRSTQFFSALDKRGDMIMVAVTCAGTCKGNHCGVSGCEIFGEIFCSPCNCFGEECIAQCSCSKTDSGTPPPQEPPEN